MTIARDRIVFFDLEAVAAKPAHHILQIAAIAVDDGLQEVDTFEVKIRLNTRGVVRQGHSKYDSAVWKRHAACPQTAAVAFARFLRGHATVTIPSPRRRICCAAQLAAHNASFDGPFLQAWSRRHDTFLPASYRVVCTMQRAMWLFLEQPHLTPPPDFKLRSLCHYFDIPLSNTGYHDALEDVRATLALYRSINSLLNPSDAQHQRIACG